MVEVFTDISKAMLTEDLKKTKQKESLNKLLKASDIATTGASLIEILNWKTCFLMIIETLR